MQHACIHLEAAPEKMQGLMLEATHRNVMSGWYFHGMQDICHVVATDLEAMSR